MNEILYSAQAIPVTPANKLRVLLSNANPDASYTVIARWQIQNKDGSISNNAETITASANGQQETFTWSLPYGNLLAVSLFVNSTLLQNGTLYGVIQLQYGTVLNPTNLLPLTAGYIAGNAALNYPLSEPKAVNDGNPSYLTRNIGDPAAGAEIDYQASQTGYTKITGGSFLLICDANVAARLVNVTLTANGAPIWSVDAAATVAANSSTRFIICDTPPPTVVPANFKYIQLPRIQPIFNLRLRTTTANIQVGDQYSEINIANELYVQA